MEKKYLIVNTGSASKKYALYAGPHELAMAHLEKEDGEFVATLVQNSGKEKRIISKKDFDASIAYLLKLFLSEKLIREKSDVRAIGMRIVAPGTYFLSHKLIDAAYLKKLEEAKERAPLHLRPTIKELGQLKKAFPATPILGVSDSAFHASMPDTAKRYGLPEKISAKLDIYRYGYHGISFQSVVRKSQDIFGKIPEKMVICHLGSGTSIAAIKNGKSIDTSMGFTPLEGVAMGTRIGNIDAGAIIYLGQKLKMDPDKLGRFLNTECGLLGLSGKTADVRELLALEARGNKGAKLALETFIYHVKKFIGAYAAALGGLDALVFTATIGERSWIMRKRICEGLEGLGTSIDMEKNHKTVSTDGFIESDKSRVRIAVIPTDEMREIAKELLKKKL